MATKPEDRAKFNTYALGLDALTQAKIPFLVGGGFALTQTSVPVGEPPRTSMSSFAPATSSGPSPPAGVTFPAT